MKIVVDHIAGSRRGQRQELDATERLRFGRHPDNEISFDAHRDLDASSRHAELRRNAGGDGYVLVDVGSSNGMLVGGERVGEIPVPIGESLDVEFGVGGPRVRLFIGDEIPEQPSASTLNMPAAAPAPRERRGVVPLILLAIVLVVAAIVIALVVRAS